MDKIPVFYAVEMLAETDSRSPSAGKPREVVAAWIAAGFPIEFHPVTPVTVDELCAVHEPGFVRAILACKEGGQRVRQYPPRCREVPSVHQRRHARR
jgi:hypothetical protein